MFFVNVFNNYAECDGEIFDGQLCRAELRKNFTNSAAFVVLLSNKQIV